MTGIFYDYISISMLLIFRFKLPGLYYKRIPERNPHKNNYMVHIKIVFVLTFLHFKTDQLLFRLTIIPVLHPKNLKIRISACKIQQLLMYSEVKLIKALERMYRRERNV
uniref:Uncharacterized protein n=1 Tax=Micrurus paraensis TaxID=1970185 RepID=A0A2D4K7Y9_9SAUR